MRPGDTKAPNKLPITTSTMAAASSPPALRVISTLDAIVVGKHDTTIMPTRTLVSMACVRRSPAAIMIWTMTKDDHFSIASEAIQRDRMS
jgi:hypothetical protein